MQKTEVIIQDSSRNSATFEYKVDILLNRPSRLPLWHKLQCCALSGPYYLDCLPHHRTDDTWQFYIGPTEPPKMRFLGETWYHVVLPRHHVDVNMTSLCQLYGHGTWHPFLAKTSNRDIFLIRPLFEAKQASLESSRRALHNGAICFRI
jgi:hypothetical protein